MVLDCSACAPDDWDDLLQMRLIFYNRSEALH